MNPTTTQPDIFLRVPYEVRGEIFMSLIASQRVKQLDDAPADTETAEQLAAANARIQELTKTLERQSDQAREALEEIKALEASNHRQSVMLAEALKEIQRLSPKPDTPPVVVPGEVKPVITKTVMNNMIGVTITKDDTPSPEQDEMTKQLLTLSGEMGFNTWRGLLNYEEVVKQSAYGEDDPRNLPAFGRRHGLEFIADSMNTQAERVTQGKLTKAQFALYFAGLKKLGARAIYVDDVDDPRKTPFIKDWIDLIREGMAAAGLDVPLIGSFMATFDRAKFPVFDHYEIQCFGNPEELKKYVARVDIRVFCLDGQRSVSVAELRVNAGITLAAGIDNMMFYTGYDGKKEKETDWREMPAQVAEIKDFIGKWRLQRQAFVAQDA